MTEPLFPYRVEYYDGEFIDLTKDKYGGVQLHVIDQGWLNILIIGDLGNQAVDRGPHEIADRASVWHSVNSVEELDNLIVALQYARQEIYGRSES